MSNFIIWSGEIFQNGLLSSFEKEKKNRNATTARE